MSSHTYRPLKFILRKKGALIALIIILLSIPVAIYLIRNQQTKRNEAATTYTYMRQVITSKDGKTSWNRDCPVIASGPDFTSCTPWSNPADLRNLRGTKTTTGVDETYGAYGAFAFTKNGAQVFRQTLYSLNGATAWNRDCPIDVNALRGDLCPAWSAGIDLSNVRGVGNERYSSFSGFFYTLTSGVVFRQTLISLDGKTSWNRDCSVNAAGPDLNACGAWSAPFDLTNLRGTKTTTGIDEAYAAFSGVVYNQNNQQTLRQVFFSLDGTKEYSRTCPINSTTGIVGASCSTWSERSIVSLRGVGGETYGAYEEFTYTVSYPLKSRPNVMVFMIDDLEMAVMNRALELNLMPNLKKYVIDKGATFTNSFVTHSVCCPSRATFLTGLYTHNHNVKATFPDDGIGGANKFNDSSTLATWLRAAGYETAMIGKYLNGYGSSDMNKDGTFNTADRLYKPPGWSNWQPLLDNNTYKMFEYEMNENGTIKTYGTATTDYQTDVLSQKGVTIISNSGNIGVPFFLYMAPAAVHIEAPTNFQYASITDAWKAGIRPAPRHVGSVNTNLPNPPSLNETVVTDKPSWIREYPTMTATDLTNLRKQFNDRIAAFRAVDDMVGAMGLALEQTGQLNRTTIIFTSDNGYQNGEHRISGKSNAYEESIRIPLYIYTPSIPQKQTITPIALNNDLASTISEVVGITPGATVDGRSLLPLMRNPNIPWRKKFLIEHWYSPFNFWFDVPTYAAIRTVSTRIAPNKTYVEYTSGEKEYYNNLLDPYQLNSLHGSVSDAPDRTILSQWLSQLKTCSGASCRSAEDSDPSPSSTISPTRTATPTPIPTRTPTPTLTPTRTLTQTPTKVITNTPTVVRTATPSPTRVITNTPSPVNTITIVPTSTPIVSISITPIPTITPSITNTSTPTSVATNAPQEGDCDGDSRVDGVDFVCWLNHYNQNVSGPSNGDYDNDGKVDGIDYAIWLNNYR
jgi:N-acetylglucosamine-6-sulfatase